MKKRSLLGILLFIASVFVLVGCTNDPETPVEVTAFIVAVEDIGTVTAESGTKINGCYVLYDALNDENKARDDVKEAKTTLDGHKATYDEIINGGGDEEETKIATFIAAANLVPEASAITENTLTAAKAAYKVANDAYALLSEASKADASVVSAYAKVTAAKTKIDQVEAQIAEKDDRDAADAFIAEVAKIGEVTIDSKSKIDAAQVLYDALSAKAKAMSGVSGALDTLNAAKTRHQTLVNERDAKVFTDAVAALETAGGGLLANDDAIDAALTVYAGLSDGAKSVDGVAAAKTQLDGYRSDCDAAIIVENSRVFNKAYDAAKAYSGSDLDAELELINAALSAYEDLDAASKTANAAKKTELDGLKTTCLGNIDVREANSFKAAVAAITDVTLESGEAINSALALYAGLSDGAKAVDGVAAAKTTLDGYKNTFDLAVRQANVDEFVDAVDAIVLADLTLEDENDVLTARALYTALTDLELAMDGVSDALAYLVLLEARIVELKDAAELLLRADFLAKAALLPEAASLKTSDEAKLLAAEAAYALLRADSKEVAEIVTAYQNVTAARTRMNSFQKITITGSDLLSNQGGVQIQMTSFVWDSLATFYNTSVSGLKDLAAIYLNIYLMSETNNQNYVARMELSSTSPKQFFTKAELESFLSSAAIGNQLIVTGQYKFTVSVEDLTGEYRNSGYYGGRDNTTGFSTEKPTLTITLNAQVAAFLSAVEAIGTVAYTSDSNTLITAAETAYAAVNASYKSIERIVDAYAVVVAARARYNELKVAQDLINDIAEFGRLVGLIPSTLEEGSVAFIEAAESFYNTHKDRIKDDASVIANLAILEAARESYDSEFGPEAEAGIAFVVMVGKLPAVADLVYATHKDAVAAARAAQALLTGKGLLVAGYADALAKLEDLEDQIVVLLGLGEDAADAYAALADAIGTVTYSTESLEKIVAAETAYAALKPEAFVNESKASAIAVAKVVMEAARDLYDELSVLTVPFANVTSAGGWTNNYSNGAWYLSVPVRGGENDWWKNEIHFNVSAFTSGSTLTLVFRGDAGEAYLLKGIDKGYDYLVTGLGSQTTFIADGTIQTFVMDLEGRGYVNLQELGIFHRDGSKAATFELYDLIPSTKSLNETALAAANTYLTSVNNAIAVNAISATQLASLNEIKEDYSDLSGKAKIYSGGAYNDIVVYLAVYNAASSAADSFISAVAALPASGSVTLADITNIAAARTAYSELSALAKTKDGVSSANERLEGLYTEYLGKKAQSDANAFYALVNAIPSDNVPGSQVELEAAEAAYVALNDAAKAIVDAEADKIALLRDYRIEFDASVFAAQVTSFKEVSALSFPEDVTAVAALIADYDDLTSDVVAFFEENFAAADTKYDAIVAAYTAYTDSLGVILSTTLPETASVNVGASSVQYTVTITQGDLNTATWSTSDATVATVNNGVITGVKVGTAVITVTSDDDPTKSASCTVTVNADPYASYLKIGTKAQWDSIMVSSNISKSICLTADIDLGGSSYTSPLGNFSGTFDGRGYKVSNATFTNFFGYEPTGTVKNLELEVSSSGGNHTGILFRQLGGGGGEFRNIIVTATFASADNSSVFGVFGNGKIYNCIVYVNSSLSSGTGFAGYVQGGVFNNCHYTALSGFINAGGMTSRTLAYLKTASNFTTYDSTYWNIVDGSLPTLKKL